MHSMTDASRFHLQETEWESRERPRIYMVSVDYETSASEYVERTGSYWRLWSFYRFYQEPYLLEYVERTLQHGCRLFLDSGAHSWQMHSRGAVGKVVQYDKVSATEREREKFFQAYIDFCHEHGWKFETYANFDYVEHSPTVWSMQQKMESRGLRPIPTVHGDSGEEWMQRYIDEGHRYLGVGAGARWGSQLKILPYLDKVFNLAARHKIRLHGYGMTSWQILLGYPWFSVDSSTWMKVRAHGQIIVPINGRIHNVKITHIPTHQLESIRRIVERKGFDFHLMCGDSYETNQHAWRERGIWNMYVLQNLWDLDLATPAQWGAGWGALLR